MVNKHNIQAPGGMVRRKTAFRFMEPVCAMLRGGLSFTAELKTLSIMHKKSIPQPMRFVETISKKRRAKMVAHAGILFLTHPCIEELGEHTRQELGLMLQTFMYEPQVK